MSFPTSHTNFLMNPKISHFQNKNVVFFNRFSKYCVLVTYNCTVVELSSLLFFFVVVGGGLNHFDHQKHKLHQVLYRFIYY